MIARLAGRLFAVESDGAVIDVGGVGYRVFASGRTLARLPDPGGAVALMTELDVGQDHLRLYGFADAAERDWFHRLTTVQGVGSRVALAILSVLEPDALAQALAAGDKAPLTRASGVGPKLAGRIVAELKDTAAGLLAGLAGAAPGAVAPPVGGAAESGVEGAISALANLGYGRAEAAGAVARAAAELGERAEEGLLIARALKTLGKGRA
ncbi:Holliday junction branch migration protein RuvA [Roseospirillum parvum]|uniref:Holliday junction branch migration complex subunit RuvA n=1 Tax=Roseospirillum parvum TaxID=83401 RepID=A0A1G7XN76_9PROT|nr:Holliday junction branch migration protein RuvA [Roseospirillum parvum]SDG85516.1 holliday junction DNA helicase RuvA [Roseospirillum parvum]